DEVVGADGRARVIEGTGRGPAAARNAGIAMATGDLVLFTDDDAVPQPGWLEAAIDCFTRHPEAVGVVGLVESPPFDPLYEPGVRSEGVGNFLTCNVAYRRATLVALGGFDDGFPDSHCEDRDLGYRAHQIGAVVF